MIEREEIVEIFEKIAYLDKGYIRDDMSIQGELFMDSLGFMQAIVEIERKIGEKIPYFDIELSTKLTFGELVNKINIWQASKFSN